MILLNELELIAACQLVEDVSWDASKPLEGQLQQAVDMMLAARRALGIANRLSNPADRKKHRSRIMGILNSLSASCVRLHTAIQGEMSVLKSSGDDVWSSRS